MSVIFVILEPRISPSEIDMFPTIMALMATDNSGSDVEKATRRKLITDFLNLHFSHIATILDTTIPLAPPSNTKPTARNIGENCII